MLVFHMGLNSLGRVGYAVCFVFAACGVIRLARFNILPPDHHSFIGLPIPMAAAATLIPALVTRGEPLSGRLIWAQAAQVSLIALLMVSRIRYRSFKDLHFSPGQYRVLAACVLLVALLAVLFEWMLPAVVGFYVVSPAVFWVYGRITGRRGSRERVPPARPSWRLERGRDLDEEDGLN
jgi:CDP-diacylglycerol--serine O-phosphatidyltransferase